MGLLIDAFEDGKPQMSMRNLKRFFDQADCKPKQQIAEGSAHSADTIESGDFQINLAKRTATVCGRELQLTSEEFDVLVFLSKHPQRLVTPHTMLATKWVVSGPRQTAFLSSLISLRNKLDSTEAGKRYLRTEPWVIYHFNPAPTKSSKSVEPSLENSKLNSSNEAGY